MDTDHDIDHWLTELNSALIEWNSDLSGAEFHGALCGLVACSAIPTEQHIGPKISAVVGQSVDSHSLLLSSLWGQAKAQLNSETFGLVPLITEDDPNSRLEQLAHWAQGFLMGVGYAQRDLKSSPETLQALEDLVAISQVATDEDESIDLADLEEVFEYTRMTAHLVYMETHQTETENLTTHTNH